ncbi:hypothetical protein GCM10009120_04210 [Sphingobacterium siyangense subsp. cladoniae]|uniref:hypothetical protein n=1 Tax=Sphingobacterium siyangense TaxID=459529 RepID=UPI0031FA0DE4
MEETIDILRSGEVPGQPLRITFKGQDFQVRILDDKLCKNLNEITILLDGIVQKLRKERDRWYFENTEDDKEFANDIGRAIALRYRL